MTDFVKTLNETIMGLEETEEVLEVSGRGESDVAEATRNILKLLYHLRFPDASQKIMK